MIRVKRITALEKVAEAAKAYKDARMHYASAATAAREVWDGETQLAAENAWLRMIAEENALFVALDELEAI